MAAGALPAQPGDDDEIRGRLTSERRRVEGLLRDEMASADLGRAQTDSTGALSSVDQHPADQASETVAREVGEALVGSLRAELAAVAAAFERLDAGTYGQCVACHRPISPERLAVLPATPFCIDDARLAETEAVRGGGPTSDG
jgi:RNA polymerase-binding transcription factor DksA